MKIVLINKRFTPQRSATGYHAHQLALYLQTQGHVVSLIHTIRGNSDIIIAEDNLNRAYIKSFYEGKHLFLRFLWELIDSIRLIHKAKKIKADQYIVLSDPPFLQYISSYFLNPKQTTFWFMDVYPQAFVAHGLIKPSGWLESKYVKRLSFFNPKLFLSLGDNQSSFLKNLFGFSKEISIPVGLQKIKKVEAKKHPDWYNNEDFIYFGYRGNLGSAHDLNFLTRLADSLHESKHRFIISASGVKSKDLFNRLKDYSTVIFPEEIIEQDLLFIDVHIVTLLPQWTHICVPSKALMAASTKGTVLFHGTIDSDTWSYIKDIGWHISDEYPNNDEIQNFLTSITKETIEQKKLKATEVYHKLSKDLTKSYQKIESQMR